MSWGLDYSINTGDPNGVGNMRIAGTVNGNLLGLWTDTIEPPFVKQDPLMLEPDVNLVPANVGGSPPFAKWP